MSFLVSASFRSHLFEHKTANLGGGSSNLFGRASQKCLGQRDFLNFLGVLG